MCKYHVISQFCCILLVVTREVLRLINQATKSCSKFTHWGRATHTCVVKLTIIGSDNGLSPYRRQAIFWTNAGILLIRPLGTNFSDISIEVMILSFKKMRLKVSPAKRRPICLGFNELKSQLWGRGLPVSCYYKGIITASIMISVYTVTVWMWSTCI